MLLESLGCTRDGAVPTGEWWESLDRDVIVT